ncbi:heme-binding protein 2-like isoform X2 [Tigriopus californicus]|uniref:heme-binding protein 2-like isoform X2 n=1 Tax=Tigriopus californicus TaxID=6832 RepID=UPI0027DA18C4|nr:heme-binding protein 2-like isoform X2 [Tigriopus californicus]
MFAHIFLASILIISPVLGQNDDIEVAPYEVVETKASYEVRDYPARKWVSTDNAAKDIHGGIEHSVSFDRLFQYISGNNVNNTKIDMTSPVTFFIQRSDDPEAEQEFTMSFYIPAVHQDDPIQPQAENVYIEDRAGFRRVFLNCDVVGCSHRVRGIRFLRGL